MKIKSDENMLKMKIFDLISYIEDKDEKFTEKLERYKNVYDPIYSEWNYCTLDEEYGDFQINILQWVLPKKYESAIKICRRKGFEYFNVIYYFKDGYILHVDNFNEIPKLSDFITEKEAQKIRDSWNDE